MELKGKPGEEVWIKATVNFVQIGLDGASYFVDIEGQLVQFPESAVMAVSVLDDPKTVKREELKEDPLEEPEAAPKDPGAVPADPEEVPKKRRGRPRKATVEDLVARAEGERSQRIEIPDTPADRVHELVKKDDLKRRTAWKKS